MFDAHITVSHPISSITEHGPAIQIVTFTSFAKGTHFLVSRKSCSEMVAVQISTHVGVCQLDGLPAFGGVPFHTQWQFSLMYVLMVTPAGPVILRESS